CNLCGADDPEPLYEGLSIVRCRRCGLVYATPQPGDAALASLYADAYFTERSHPGEPAYVENRAGLERFFDDRLRRLERFVPPGRLLEVGSNLGYLLNAAGRRGWQAVGLELSEFAVRYAREHFAVDIRGQALEDAGFEQAAFDAVVMRDVLEHVRDPRATLAETHRVLRAGGVLALSAPNFASLDARLGGPAWRHLHPEQHLYHFAPDTLGRLLRESGYEVVEMTSRYDSPAAREVYAALDDPALRRRLACHGAARGDIVFLPLGSSLRRVLRAAAIVLSVVVGPVRNRLRDDILEVHARKA
ncbi:MAG: class I SAM-dependent methyltransferase, partial [Planctomycetota bacterium]